MLQSAHTEIITVSREFGAGGSELARRLGERLGWPVLDDEVACRCAQRLHIETSAVERLREHSPTLLARLSSALLVAPPEAPGIDTTHLLRIDAIAEAAFESITEAARTLPLIVVGFGTQCIFAERPDALHVRLFAPMETRVERLRARYGWDATMAAMRARRMDEDRRRYVQRYFHRDVLDPLLYDVQINTGRTTIEEAVNLIEQLVRGDHGKRASTVGRREHGAGAIA
ncbi:MAG: cytidylate kinase-like family protein [Gemmatimonadaceae bacterium]|nr:cytidylate kinase-like family protein [Gemmatimonadaceae bacterium]